MGDISAIGTKKQWWLDFWNISKEDADRAWAAKLELDAKGSYKAGFEVISDIEPYKSMATGEMITSRSTHRNHLKERGLVEVGNEQPKPRQTEPTKKEREALRYDIAARLDSHR